MRSVFETNQPRKGYKAISKAKGLYRSTMRDIITNGEEQ